MKKLLFCIGTLIAVLFSSCSSDSEKKEKEEESPSPKSKLAVQYIPFKMNKYDNWGLINANGEILYDNEFKTCPSLVINGFFNVANNDNTYSVNKITKDTPTEIIDGLYDAGYMSNGLIPITKKNSRICYINENGEEQFSLEPYQGNEIAQVSSFFSDSLAIICIKKKNKTTGYSESKYGAINTSGDIVIEPIYDQLDPFKNGLAVALIESSSDSIVTDEYNSQKNKFIILNTKGEEVSSYNANYFVSRYNNYCVFSSDDKQTIVNINNNCEELSSLKSNQYVSSLSDKYFVFKDAYNDKCGVKGYNNNTDVLFKGNFDYITIINDNRFFVKQNNSKGKYYDKNGKEIEAIDSVEFISNLNHGDNSLYFDFNNFIIMAKQDYENYALLNNDLNEIVSLKDLCLNINLWVESDYFDATVFLDKTLKDLKTNGYIYTLGKSAKSLSSKLPNLKDVNNYSYYYYPDNGLTLEFTSYIIEDNSSYEYDYNTYTYNYVENRSISNNAILERISGSIPFEEDIKYSKLDELFQTEISKYLQAKGWREVSSSSDEVIMESDNCKLILTRYSDSFSFNIILRNDIKVE